MSEVALTVDDYTPWDTCAMRKVIPAEYEIRRFGNSVAVVHREGDNILHLEMDMKEFNGKTANVILGNLAGARFEREYPGQTLEMFRRKAEALAGLGLLTDDEIKRQARYDELNSWRSS